MINTTKYSLPFQYPTWSGEARSLGSVSLTEWLQTAPKLLEPVRVKVEVAGETAEAQLEAPSGAGFPIDPSRLHGCVLLTGTTGSLDGLVGYLAARRARVMNSHLVVMESGSPLAERVSASAIPGVEGYVAQRVDRMCSALFDDVPADARGALFTDELVETTERWLQELWQVGFFRAVSDRTLTREQYIYTLENMHQFVRWTTRILGRCVGHAHDGRLRDHFLDHLAGEVNHERLIETDLEALGVSVDFMKESMAPNAGTRIFMAVQESAVGFHHDPVMLMASPTAAEGMSAHLSPLFIESLLACIKGFGVAEPAKAARFLTSHVKTDGGDDGHWVGTIASIAHQLLSDSSQQMFLSTLRASMSGLKQSFADAADHMALFGPEPS